MFLPYDQKFQQQSQQQPVSTVAKYQFNSFEEIVGRWLNHSYGFHLFKYEMFTQISLKRWWKVTEKTEQAGWGGGEKSGLSVCLSVCLPACLPVCLSVCLSVCPSVCLSVNLSLHLFLPLSSSSSSSPSPSSSSSLLLVLFLNLWMNPYNNRMVN